MTTDAHEDVLKTVVPDLLYFNEREPDIYTTEVFVL